MFHFQFCSNYFFYEFWKNFPQFLTLHNIPIWALWLTLLKTLLIGILTFSTHSDQSLRMTQREEISWFLYFRELRTLNMSISWPPFEWIYRGIITHFWLSSNMLISQMKWISCHYSWWCWHFTERWRLMVEKVDWPAMNIYCLRLIHSLDISFPFASYLSWMIATTTNRCGSCDVYFEIWSVWGFLI